MPDDQLSLAIGKHGQNVRLASKLTSWELDIRTRQEIVQEKEEAKKTRAQMTLDGVGEKVLDALIDAGFDSLEKIRGASVDRLTQIKGIGAKKAEKIIEAAKERLSKTDESA